MSEDDIVRYVKPPGGFQIPEEELVRLRAMTDEEITAAALSDPDCPPMSEEQLARMKRVTVARSARWRSGLTQQEFADTFGFTLGRLRDLEQGRTKPDPATERYLKVIQARPDLMRDMAKDVA